jgi:hypothetical protein
VDSDVAKSKEKKATGCSGLRSLWRGDLGGGGGRSSGKVATSPVPQAGHKVQGSESALMPHNKYRKARCTGCSPMSSSGQRKQAYATPALPANAALIRRTVTGTVALSCMLVPRLIL